MDDIIISILIFLFKLILFNENIKNVYRICKIKNKNKFIDKKSKDL